MTYKFNHKVTSSVEEYLTWTDQGYVDIEFLGDKDALIEALKDPDSIFDLTYIAALAELCLETDPKFAYAFCHQYESYDVARINYVLARYYFEIENNPIHPAGMAYRHKAERQGYIPASFYWAKNAVLRGYLANKALNTPHFQDLCRCMEAGYAPALFYGGIAMLGEEDSKEAGVVALVQAANDGYLPAMALVGYLFEQGFVFEKDEASAVTWYRLASNRGSQFASARLVELIEAGVADPHPFEKKEYGLSADIASIWLDVGQYELLLPYLRCLIEQEEHPVAKGILAISYRLGLGQPTDASLADAYCAEALKDDPEVSFALADKMYSYYQTGQFELGDDLYDKCKGKSPWFSYLYFYQMFTDGLDIEADEEALDFACQKGIKEAINLKRKLKKN